MGPSPATVANSGDNSGTQILPFQQDHQQLDSL